MAKKHKKSEPLGRAETHYLNPYSFLFDKNFPVGPKLDQIRLETSLSEAHLFDLALFVHDFRKDKKGE